jgi:hypothetical protein
VREKDRGTSVRVYIPVGVTENDLDALGKTIVMTRLASEILQGIPRENAIMELNGKVINDKNEQKTDISYLQTNGIPFQPLKTFLLVHKYSMNVGNILSRNQVVNLLKPTYSVNQSRDSLTIKDTVAFEADLLRRLYHTCVSKLLDRTTARTARYGLHLDMAHLYADGGELLQVLPSFPDYKQCDVLHGADYPLEGFLFAYKYGKYDSIYNLLKKAETYFTGSNFMGGDVIERGPCQKFIEYQYNLGFIDEENRNTGQLVIEWLVGKQLKPKIKTEDGHEVRKEQELVYEHKAIKIFEIFIKHCVIYGQTTGIFKNRSSINVVCSTNKLRDSYFQRRKDERPKIHLALGHWTDEHLNGFFDKFEKWVNDEKLDFSGSMRDDKVFVNFFIPQFGNAGAVIPHELEHFRRNSAGCNNKGGDVHGHLTSPEIIPNYPPSNGVLAFGDCANIAYDHILSQPGFNKDVRADFNAYSLTLTLPK